MAKKKSKEVSRISQLKTEFIEFAKSEYGKEISNDVFWQSANGIMLLFVFQQLERIEGNNASLETLIDEINKEEN